MSSISAARQSQAAEPACRGYWPRDPTLRLPRAREAETSADLRAAEVRDHSVSDEGSIAAAVPRRGWWPHEDAFLEFLQSALDRGDDPEVAYSAFNGDMRDIAAFEQADANLSMWLDENVYDDAEEFAFVLSEANLQLKRDEKLALECLMAEEQALRQAQEDAQADGELARELYESERSYDREAELRSEALAKELTAMYTLDEVVALQHDERLARVLQDELGALGKGAQEDRDAALARELYREFNQERAMQEEADALLARQLGGHRVQQMEADEMLARQLSGAVPNVRDDARIAAELSAQLNGGNGGRNEGAATPQQQADWRATAAAGSAVVAPRRDPERIAKLGELGTLFPNVRADAIDYLLEECGDNLLVAAERLMDGNYKPAPPRRPQPPLRQQPPNFVPPTAVPARVSAGVKGSRRGKKPRRNEAGALVFEAPKFDIPGLRGQTYHASYAASVGVPSGGARGAADASGSIMSVGTYLEDFERDYRRPDVSGSGAGARLENDMAAQEAAQANAKRTPNELFEKARAIMRSEVSEERLRVVVEDCSTFKELEDALCRAYPLVYLQSRMYDLSSAYEPVRTGVGAAGPVSALRYSPDRLLRIIDEIGFVAMLPEVSASDANNDSMFQGFRSASYKRMEQSSTLLREVSRLRQRGQIHEAGALQAYAKHQQQKARHELHSAADHIFVMNNAGLVERALRDWYRREHDLGGGPKMMSSVDIAKRDRFKESDPLVRQQRYREFYAEHPTEIDLHGLLRNEAKLRLFASLHLASKWNWGRVRVVTGRGTNSVRGTPILREMVEAELGDSRCRFLVRSFAMDQPGSFLVNVRPAGERGLGAALGGFGVVREAHGATRGDGMDPEAASYLVRRRRANSDEDDVEYVHATRVTGSGVAHKTLVPVRRGGG